MKSRRAHSPHLPHGGTIAIRDREIERIGFIVDAGIAEALHLAFVAHRTFPDVHIAHTESPCGIGVTIVQRSRDFALDLASDDGRAIEALAEFGIRQIITLSHRVLQPIEGEFSARDNASDALTIDVEPADTCTRLFSAVNEVARSDGFVHGVFTRDEKHLSDAVLNAEKDVARRLGFCLSIIEATTLRVDENSTASESALGRILRAIPDAVSPLTSCTCHSTPARQPDERAG